METGAVFPRAPLRAGMYESFYLRAVSPEDPVAVWIRHTVHKAPGREPIGSIWCTVFDARRGGSLHAQVRRGEAEPPTRGVDRSGRAGVDGPRGGGGVLRGSAVVAALRHEGEGAAPPHPQLALPLATATDEAHEPSSRRPLRGDARAGRGALAQPRRVAGNGGSQLGLRAR